MRFEHCYRLDLDPTVAPSHRLACWREWTQRYGYGQTRDRLEYARRRVRYLDAGETAVMRLELTDPGDAGVGPELAAGAPAPTSVYAPPPSTLAPAGTDPKDAGPPAELDPPPQAPCVSNCEAAYRTCRGPCSGEKAPAPCTGCEPDYRACVRRCVD